MATTENIYKVRLVNINDRSENITFDVSPDFQESRAVNYTPLEPVQAPGQIFIYKNTSSRTFDLGDVKLISRSQVEASKNMRNLQIIRSWTLPWFGHGTESASLGTTVNSAKSIAGVEVLQENIEAANKTLSGAYDQILKNLRSTAENLGSTIKTGKQQAEENKERIRSSSQDPSRIISRGAALGAGGGGGGGAEELGAPPAVLWFSAYSSGRQELTNLNKIPVVIQNLSIAYPSDVDFIPTFESLEPMPTIMSISISLIETHAPTEYNDFSLIKYKNGELPRF